MDSDRACTSIGDIVFQSTFPPTFLPVFSNSQFRYTAFVALCYFGVNAIDVDLLALDLYPLILCVAHTSKTP